MALHLGENGCYGVMIHNTRNLTDEQLMKEFSKYGKVLELQKGGRNLVFAQFKEYGEARACLDELQDKPEYCAKPARPRESRPISKSDHDNPNKRSRSVGRALPSKPAYNNRCKSMNRLEAFKRELHKKKQVQSDDDIDSNKESQSVKESYKKDPGLKQKDSPASDKNNNTNNANKEVEKSNEINGKEGEKEGTGEKEKGIGEGGGREVGEATSSGSLASLERGMSKDVRFSDLNQRNFKRDVREHKSRRPSRSSHQERHHSNNSYSNHHYKSQHQMNGYSTSQLENPNKPQSLFQPSMMPGLIDSQGPMLVQIVDLEDAEQIRSQGTRYLYDVILYNFPLWFMMGDVYDLCSRYVKVLHVDMFYSHDPRTLPYAIIFVGSTRQAKHLVNSLNGTFYKSKRLMCFPVADLIIDDYGNDY